MSFISAVKHTVSNGAVKTYQAIKVSALWLGRSVQRLGQGYIIPAAQAVFMFFRTGFGLGSLALGLGSGLIALAHHDKLQGDSKRIARWAINAAAIVSFIGAGVLLAARTAIVI